MSTATACHMPYTLLHKLTSAQQDCKCKQGITDLFMHFQKIKFTNFSLWNIIDKHIMQKIAAQFSMDYRRSHSCSHTFTKLL